MRCEVGWDPGVICCVVGAMVFGDMILADDCDGTVCDACCGMDGEVVVSKCVDLICLCFK